MRFQFIESPLGLPFDAALAANTSRTHLKFEMFVQRVLERDGWKVLNNDYSVFFRAKSKSAQWEKSEPTIQRLFGGHGLDALRLFCARLYTENTELPNPGHPDLVVYRSDFSEVRFVEVKGTSNDRLSHGEMLGLSLIKIFLQAPCDVVRVEGKCRTYDWTWPVLES